MPYIVCPGPAGGSEVARGHGGVDSPHSQSKFGDMLGGLEVPRYSISVAIHTNKKTTSRRGGKISNHDLILYYVMAYVILSRLTWLLLSQDGIAVMLPMAFIDLLQHNLGLHQTQSRTLHELHRFVTSNSTPIAKVGQPIMM